MDDALFTIGLLADVHSADTNYASRHCTDAAAKLAECVATFNERNVDMVVNLGDSVDGVSQSRPATDCLADVTAALAGCPGPRHTVIGNHDVECLDKAQLLTLAGGEIAQPYYSFDEAGLHFAILDTNNYADGRPFTPTDHPDYWGDAWLGTPQLDWLADDLSSAGKTPTIIFAHAGLDHHEVAGLRDPHCVIDALAAREIFAAAGNVRAVFQGHYHPGRSAAQAGIPYVTLAAMCEGESPENAYAIATFHADGAITIDGAGRQESIEIPPSQ